MAISAVIIVICTVLATLAIAMVIPADQLNLASGVMQAIQYFFTAAHVPWLVAPMAVLITLGGVVSLAAWLIGPAKGLGIVAEEGNMPPIFDRTNKYGAPVAVLVIQALIGSAVSLLYVFLPSVNQAYWILSAMTVELLCIVYVLVFAAVIKLRYSQPDTPRPFRIPGGHAGHLDCRGPWDPRHHLCLHCRAHAPVVLPDQRARLCRVCASRDVPACSPAARLPALQKSLVDEEGRCIMKKITVLEIALVLFLLQPSSSCLPDCSSWQPVPMPYYPVTGNR